MPHPACISLSCRYVRIGVAIQRQPLLMAAKFDPFHVQKLAAFKKSRSSMASMAAAVHELIGKSDVSSDESSTRESLYQVMQVRNCLPPGLPRYLIMHAGEES